MVNVYGKNSQYVYNQRKGGQKTIIYSGNAEKPALNELMEKKATPLQIIKQTINK